jgi:hypothetical protein
MNPNKDEIETVQPAADVDVEGHRGIYTATDEEPDVEGHRAIL